MIKNIFNWIKTNKFLTVLALAFGYLLLSRERFPIAFTNQESYNTSYDSYSGVGSAISAKLNNRGGYGMGAPLMMEYNPAAPTPDITDRKITKDTFRSMQVENVSSTIDNIKQETTKSGGYVINANVSRPELGESGNISVRVPSDSLSSFMDFLRSNSVKVISETSNSSDITDQYVDIQERLTQLDKEKTMLQQILAKAVTVEDIMSVRPYITQIQNEIDSYKGQLKYMDGISQTSLVTAYLATDELALPYVPEKSWRPQVIVKEATRSLILNLQQGGTALIWLGVYSVIIVPALILALTGFVIARKYLRAKK